MPHGSYNKKVIKKYSVLLDYDEIGYEIEAIIELSISKGKLIEVEKRIAKMMIVVFISSPQGLTKLIY